MSLPRIAVTMGDPAGIGPEISLGLVAIPEVVSRCVPIIFGDAAVLKRVASRCGLQMPSRVISEDAWSTAFAKITEPTILDIASMDPESVRPGTVDSSTGQASYEYIDRSICSALAGQVDAVTTGPVHKEALHQAGIRYPGHTEIFAARTKAQRACMMLTCDQLTCSFVTTHVGYSEVPALLSHQRILDVIELSARALTRLNGTRPKLIVCGLNPHSGEHGLFGNREEEQFIVPAVKAARQLDIEIEGPLPPDTAFLPERRRKTDCYICMYHDQGHIPLKALAFDVAVNVTLGLPIIRTSVDHGTALDIAWKGKADVTSLIQATLLAVRLVQ